ncbi:hypothetical protein J2T02_002744 [Chitinophaga terrae (ex Kim and Jung 2007)]|nr:hypothetical protein [Chitinophaga terrae (ex Kim and Jung 2007)]
MAAKVTNFFVRLNLVFAGVASVHKSVKFEI